MDYKMIYMPWGGETGIGWVKYPKWNFMGIDVTTMLFRKGIFVPVNKLSGWNYGIDILENKNQDFKNWGMNFFGLLGNKYYIFNKDVNDIYVEKFSIILNSLPEDQRFLEAKIGNLDIYKIENTFYLPHFYTSKNNILSKRSVDELPRIASSEDWKIRSVIFFENQNIGKSDELNILKVNKIENESELPNLEFKKINPTKYRVRVHSASGIFPLVFSESFHEGWKAYLAKPSNFQFPISNFQSNPNVQLTNYKILDGNEDDPKVANSDGAGQANILDSYKILDGNSEDQASADELKDFINRGWVTDLGDGKEKEIKHQKWNEKKQREELDYVEKYKIDFVSKNFQGTIQNDNLPSKSFYETWFAKNQNSDVKNQNFSSKLKNLFDLNSNVLELPEENHLMADGYANSWIIDTDSLCGVNGEIPNPKSQVPNNIQNSKFKIQNSSGFCIQNPDGTYDFELVVEFWPQRLFYIGLFISVTTLLLCLSYLAYDWKKGHNHNVVKTLKNYENT